MTPAAAELLARYHLGLVPTREGRRLAQIFQSNPADALERVERAAAHLGVTGDEAGTLLNRAAQQGPRPAIDYLGSSASPTADRPAGRAHNASSANLTKPDVAGAAAELEDAR